MSKKKGRKQGRKRSKPVKSEVKPINFTLVTVIFLLLMSAALGYVVYDKYIASDEESTHAISSGSSGSSGGVKTSHQPIVELFTTSTCPHCPTAEHTLADLYNSGYKFTYISMVADQNQKANQRASQYGITGVPTAVYDGGITQDIGAQSEDTYRAKISQMSKRTVPDISISGDISQSSSGYSINVGLSSKSDKDINGHIRVYILEKMSRYVVYDNSHVEYGFIDFATDSSLKVRSWGTVNRAYTWNGDVSPNNIVVAVAYFDSSDHLIESIVIS